MIEVKYKESLNKKGNKNRAKIILNSIFIYMFNFKEKPLMVFL